MRYQRNLPLLVTFLILANVLALVRGQPYCLPAGNYTNNSTYQTNLHNLLLSLPMNIDDNGFYNASLGQNTDDTVYAMVLCRGDTQLTACRSCVQDTAVEMLQSCPFNRHVISWSSLCWLRYSDTSMFGIIDYANLTSGVYTENVTGDGQVFMSDLGFLLRELMPRAAGGGSLLKVAVGNRSTTNFQTIYALVQCTPDLSEQDCTACLTTCAQYLPTCCDSKGDVRIYVPSCDLRYESVPFYNETRIRELESKSAPPVPMPSPPMPPSPLPLGGGTASGTTRPIIIGVVSGFTGLMIIALVSAYLVRRKRLYILSHQPSEAHSEVHALPSPNLNPSPASGIANNLRHIKFDEIKVATNDFSKELGRGGFGAVFLGELPDSRKIAVKRMAIGSQGEKEFKAEVNILAQLRHKNLVTLIGFSSEGEDKLLVYEYVQNGSLNNFLFDQTKRSNLDWNTRFTIIGGIVKGIVYLHEDSQLKIVHRDLKPSNVLLDGEMNSKIADFGLARLLELDQSHCSTSRVIGTPGYMAPEYKDQNLFSMKSDVFSFGVLLLEIISGQKNNREGHLITTAWKAWLEGSTVNLVDPVLKVDSSITRTIEGCIHIGLLCVQPRSDKRPSINQIVTMFSSPSTILQQPSNAGFSSQTSTEYHSVHPVN